MSKVYRLLTYGNSAKYSDALEQWIRSITIDSDATELVIYALPGMGKTTFQNKQIRKGFNVADSDQFTGEWLDKNENKNDGVDGWAEPVKSRKDRQAYEQEMAWRLPLIIWPSNTRFTVTNMFNNALKGVIKLDQTLVMVRAPTFEQYWERASKRDDLLALGRATLQRWYEESADMRLIVNFTVDDWDGDFDEHLTNNLSAFGSRDVKNWRRDLSDRASVGAMLRDNILVHFRRHRMHFVGSERQTVSMLARLGARARVSGYGFQQPLFIGDVDTRLLPTGFEPAYTESNGQKKLETMNLPFYGADCSLIVSVGGSPGDHLLDLFSAPPLHKRIVVIDPLPMARVPPPWITHIPKLFSIDMLKGIVGNDDFVFLSDIRSDDFTEDDVTRDNELQLTWAKNILQTYGARCRGVSLKYRPAKTAVIYSVPSNFDIVLQCYAGGGSEETRLCWRPSNGFKWRMQIDNASYYHSRLLTWNCMREGFNVEDQQARNISHYLIESLDYTKQSFGKKELIVALFTLSNFQRNVPALLLKWCSNGVSFVSNVPFAPIYKALVDSGDRLVLRGNGGSDSVWIPMDFAKLPVHCYRISDFISQLYYANNFADLPRQPSPCNGSSRYMHEWFIVTNASFKGMLPYSPAHTIQNSQTWCVKAITAKIRLIYGLDDSSLHKLRRDVVVSNGGTPIDHRLVNGKVTIDGRDLYISISGHLINLLVASTVYAIDFNRWLDTLEFALETQYRSTRKWTRLWRQGILAEDAEKWEKFQLYHGYFDYLYSLDAYLRFCDEFDLFKNHLALAYVRSSLERLVLGFPEWKYDHGYAVRDYLSEISTQKS